MKLSVKFRLKGDVPFAIETISGTQFRCGMCGMIFYKRVALDKHLLTEKNKDKNQLKFPKLNKNISVKAIYTQEVRDRTNPLYPKLKRGDKLLNINFDNKS